MSKTELGEKIRALRKNAGLRQEDLCAKAGVSIRVIKDIEAASGNPTIDNLDSIFSVLNLDLYARILDHPAAPAAKAAAASGRTREHLIGEITLGLAPLNESQLRAILKATTDFAAMSSATKKVTTGTS